MKIIDPAVWPRKSHYEFFRTLPNPHVGLTAEVKADRLIEELAPEGVSVFNAALFCVMEAVNRVPELRTRFRGNEIVEHERVHASTTVPIENGRFAFCNIEYSPDWSAFDARCRATVEMAKKQDELKEIIERGDEWVYLSCLPWVRFTSMTHPTNGPDDCIPRIAWGRIDRAGAEWRMPVNIQVHHALVDGLHLGRFFKALEDVLATLGENADG